MSRNTALILNPAPRFRTGAATHVGKVRERNEDGYLARPDVGLWAVADGMGGLEAGDFASRTVIDALRTIERPGSAAELLAWCEQRVVMANSVLNDIGHHRGRTIGTTIAVLLAYDSRFACVWSGDSRIYLVRDRAIIPQSRDHTEVQELIAEGRLKPEEARTWPRRNVVTRAIGVHDDPELEMCDGVLQDGDTFVLCSDGLTAHVEDGEILRTVLTHGSQQACDALIELTLSRGATDNVTVVVARYQPGHDSRTGATDLWG
jgi:serine/threonine protein phosphatase PrpC